MSKELWAALPVSEEELDKLLSKAKSKLFFEKNSVFLASIMGGLKFQWDWSIPTACTNGYYVKWNPAFFLILKDKVRVTVLAHELWHVAFGHMIRRGNRDPEIWNIACDHIINTMLEKEKYSFEDIEWCCKDHKYYGLATEQVYDDLMKNPPPPVPANSLLGDIGDPTDGDDSEAAGVKAQADIINKVLSARQIAVNVNKAGDIPGEITLTLEKFLYPKLDWKTLLHRYFTERCKEDYSWSRPNRRYMSDNIILPGLMSDDALTDIMWLNDISGSVSDADILRSNSEAYHIKREFNPEHFTIATFDTKIRDIYEFTSDEVFEKMVVTGRGGTSLEPVRQFILDRKPTVAVICTDLYVEPMQPIDIPILWIVVGNPYAQVLCGDMVHMDNEEEQMISNHKVYTSAHQNGQKVVYVNPEAP